MTVKPPIYKWPTQYEYDEALLNRRTTFSDSAIKNGHLLEVSAGQPMHLNGGGSRHVCVYQAGRYVIRCFVSDPPNNVYPPADIILRYREITAYLRRMGSSLPFLVEHELIEPGVNIKGKAFPYLKLPYFANSQTLGDFLTEHYQQNNVVDAIAREWLKIVQALEENQVAHGDLDLSNVLVCGKPSAFSLYLVDFDGMYIPDFANRDMNTTDNGHAHFQPAQPGIRQFGPTMDRFSVLIIYLSLCALKMRPALWDECGASDRSLLLEAEDFQRLGQSAKFPLLRQEQRNGELQLCLDELQASINEGRMPCSLNEILQISPYIRVPELQIPSSVPLSYEGRHLVIPLDDDTTTTDERLSPTMATPDIQSSTSFMSPPVPAPAKGRTCLIVVLLIVLVIAIIIAVVIVALINAQQHPQQSPSSFVLHTLLFLLMANVTY